MCTHKHTHWNNIQIQTKRERIIKITEMIKLKMNNGIFCAIRHKTTKQKSLKKNTYFDLNIFYSNVEKTVHKYEHNKKIHSMKNII